MTRFCSVCKKHVYAPDQKVFVAQGHSDAKVKRLQRDPGRKQRPAEWATES